MIRTHAEMVFRKEVDNAISKECLFTWHEDRIISPGVPDLHYVCKGHIISNDYRVGWLELKAIPKFTASKRIQIEPSQHQYMRKWGAAMPIHFLIKVGKNVYLIPSNASREISMAVDESYLAAASVSKFTMGDDFHTLPHTLREITRI